MDFDIDKIRYSTATDIRTVLHWFKAWSRKQKEDFLKNLLEKVVPNKTELLLDNLNNMNLQDQPSPTIFQCQLRVFGSWFHRWSNEERNFLLERLETIDPLFVEELYEKVRETSGRK